MNTPRKMIGPPGPEVERDAGAGTPERAPPATKRIQLAAKVSEKKAKRRLSPRGTCEMAPLTAAPRIRSAPSRSERIALRCARNARRRPADRTAGSRFREEPESE